MITIGLMLILFAFFGMFFFFVVWLMHRRTVKKIKKALREEAEGSKPKIKEVENKDIHNMY